MKNFLYFLRRLRNELYYRLVRSVSSFRRKPAKGEETDNRAVIVKFDGIGDFILFLSAAQGIKDFYRGKELALLCSEQAAEIARPCNIFDRIEVLHKSDLRVRNLKKTARRLRQFDCEVLLNVAVSRGIHAEMAAALVRAKKKISLEFEASLPDKKIKKLLKAYDEVIPVDKTASSLEQNACIVRYLTEGDFQPYVYPLKIPKEGTVPLPEKYFVLFLGASAPWKQYPLERFREVAKKVCADTGYACVLAGDKKDDVDVGRFFENFGCEGYSYVGKTSLLQLIELIAGAKFVIGNDTSAIHIAASCNVKSLCVSSAVSADRFYPYVAGENRPIVVRKTPECRGCSFESATNLKCVGGANDCNGLPPCFSEITTDEILQKLQFLY